MIRVLIFFALLFAVALGFAWMADLPGVISISWDGYVWEQPPVVVALVVGVVLALFLAAVWLVLVILRSPKIASRFFTRRRKDKGYQALSRGLIALGTGNAKLARKHGLDADKLLKEEPATKLLLAQTAQLAGKDEEARGRFEAMLDDPETRALGLHGLFIEAERHNEPVAARHYAEEANKAVPGLEWAGKAVLGYQAVASHWEQALATLERNYTSKLIDKKTYRRHRAVILTALAQKLEEGEPERAYTMAKEAHGLALDLVPAAVNASRLATRRGDIRKASKILEATWRLSPHPDLAEAYAHVRTGDSAVDRLKRVKSLAALRANTSVGALAVARSAMDAREFDEAREQLKKVLRSEPIRAAFLMMAELEEAEHGDRGRMRDWLSRAVRAPQDKAWVADGVVSAEWQPVSPVTGRLDAFEWKTPSGLPDASAGETIEDALFEAPVLSAAVEPPVAPELAETAGSPEPAEPEMKADLELQAEPVKPAAKDKAAESEAGKAEPESKVSSEPVRAAKEGYEGTTDDVSHVKRVQDLPDSPAGAAPEPAEKAETQSAETPGAETPGAKTGKESPLKATEKKAEAKVETAGKAPSDAGVQEAKAPETAEDLDRPIAFPFSRMPDDPGTEDEEEEPKEPRPRFFN
ncbi:heme biosynthesis protein HemY [Roseibium aggregatum]|uniref:Heme biosynthesis protein HemY n=1 Tax=Roseibium aggregatum TaxID=187304 RepID=A0A926S8F4_9HYPH|nr:heme biosynthesis HemY N-terminal domain-containing protein [Roseibium aggregatum]MBD1549445.1 heme biosynthesis protein HemY [Roseibium aggregatum]